MVGQMQQGNTRRIALVTGASYGVGAATSLALAQEGYDVAISATRAENLEPILAQLEGTKSRVVPLVLDLRSQPSIERAMADILSALGALDLLVNNASATLRKLAVDVSWAEWNEVFAANVTGTFFLTQQVGRHLIRSGRPGCIVNIASTHGLVGVAHQSTYGISKAALIHMTKMLAIEWAQHHIRVNAIAPGRLDTPSPARAVRTVDPTYMQAMLDRIPLHRFAMVEEVAAAVCYLASTQAASITGHTLVLDGALTVV
jgi:NAD(P)-dependent dehydrogenase (short-subunit alcohol dehydrogenase family)